MTPDPALVSELRSALGADAVLASAEACAPFECDALNPQLHRPALVALPRSADQVMAVLDACRGHATPVVARGAGTGLSGGALPVEGGVLLVLSRLNRILELDAARRLARVEPGVTNLEISQAAAPHGLNYAPDPSSQVACTIAGNVAENSGPTMPFVFVGNLLKLCGWKPAEKMHAHPRSLSCAIAFSNCVPAMGSQAGLNNIE